MAPVADAVVPVIDVLAPVTDVVAPVPDVAGAVVSLTQLPSDLSFFLLSTVGVAPVVDGSGGTDGEGWGIAASASGASQVPLVAPLSGTPDAPAAGNAATGLSSLDATALGGFAMLSGMAPLAKEDANPIADEQSYVQRAWDFLRASLWALAAVALPGVVGLVIVTAVGVRVAYGPRPGSKRSEGTARRRH
ncbi:MAG TPA: hypothetical protein VFK56_04155 [Mycobacterium sp.]|nr:hypothetical protein [Mycobacterium sp.]